MKDISLGHFYSKLSNKKDQQPLNGQIELTYRCNLNCVHCYCKGSEEEYAPRHTLHATRSTPHASGNALESRTPNTERRKANTEHRELTTEEWKEILDEIQKEGCLWLTLTGGDPLVREDFLEIYAYAKEKGFIIVLFTNGYALTEKLVNYLAKSPPHSIEITLNGITQTTYESITQRKGSYSKVIQNIKLLKEKKLLHLILKTNCLKANKDELGRIKKWTEELLGKPTEKKYRFKYDPMIYSRLNGDKTPCQYRVSFEELIEIKKQDPDIWQEYQKGLHSDFPDLKRDRSFLYRCNAWMSQFFINPYGRLKFCIFSDKFSVDLKATSFKYGFYHVFPQVLNVRFKTDSKCQDCTLRSICYYCPARAYLETGNEEAPVEYFCKIAQAMEQEMLLTKNSAKQDHENPVLP